MRIYIMITSRENSDRIQNELFNKGIFWRGGQRHPIHVDGITSLIVESGYIMYSSISQFTIAKYYHRPDRISWEDLLYYQESLGGNIYIYDYDLLHPNSNIFIKINSQ